ncbi:hypothetical protein MJ634_002210 [Providencia rettgeri]|uniref:hypothetical protein n=1 Tax=Providencia rettgeri TaxID=587 RepID=UPI001B371BE3|nr:hypothetical protein [Providencia rettgeri]EHZ7762325.1 hypothetical protein [Providencia rettgeri]EIJ7165467.1 hypothetical protein [Providencia rettgeri]MBQ0607975.1 hypothetical protein [Providencia rettgeri]MCJ2221871.1 hypothetical protein [Providencia rettgeri]
MSDSQSAGGIHYDVSMDIKELLVGEKQVNKVMDNVEKSTDKATDSLNRLDKTASQVAAAMKMPEINKLSRDMAQLSGKIGANSAATEKAAQTHSRFTGVLSTVSGSLGAGYVGNIGSATESLIKHTQAAINATAEEIKNAEVMKKQAEAYQAEASQLVLSTQEKRKSAEEAVKLAESELQVAEALADRKTASIQNLEVLKKEQEYQLKQAELAHQTVGNEKTLAEVTKARSTVQRTQNQIEKQSTEIAQEVWKAEDKVKSAKENLHNTTIELNKAKGLEAQATATVIAADEASTIAKEKATLAAKAQVVAMNGLRSVMALLGGPTGIILLVAAGVYALYQAMSDTDKIDEFNKKIDDSIDKLEELNNAQANYAADKFGKDLESKIDKLKEYEKEINHLNAALKTSEKTGMFNKELTEELNKYKALADDTTQQIIKLTGAVSRSGEQAKRTAGQTVEQWTAQVALNNETQSLTKQNELLARSLLDGEAAARDTMAINEFREKLEKLGITGDTATDAIDAFSSALQFNKDLTLGVAVDKMKEKVEELTIRLNKGEEAAIRFNAQMMIKNSGWDENSEDAKEYIRLSEMAAKLTKQISDGKKNGRTGTKKDKAEEGLKRQQNEVEALKKRYELLSSGVEDVNKEMAAFEAAQKLGSKATDKQKEAAAKEAEEIYNLTQKISDFNRAQEATPELKLAREFGEEAKTIRRMFDEGFIDKETFVRLGKEATEAFESGMADIKVNASVSALDEARAKVDPIQALQNENTQKLALIKEYMNQKILTEQEGLAMMDLANKEYEQNRVNAMYDLWRNQSLGNEAAAAAFDSLAGNASNALTGIITQSMTAADAARSLGRTVLNSLINSYVQAGIEQAKAAWFGAGQEQAALAATTAAQTAAVGTQTAVSTAAAATTTAAWTPAAIMASIASMGTAAKIGMAAVAVLGIGAIAGKRKNGGNVKGGAAYEVGEENLPELMQIGNKLIAIPGNNGRVFSYDDVTGSAVIPKASTGPTPSKAKGNNLVSSGGKDSINNLTVIIENHGSPTTVVDQRMEKGLNEDDVLRIIMRDANEKGPALQSIIANTTATPRL